MSRCPSLARPLLRGLSGNGPVKLAIRPFSMNAAAHSDAPTAPTGQTTDAAPAAQLDPTTLDPNTAVGRAAELALQKAGRPPIGSRRRRMAIRTSQNLPFEQLPFQCFQEARKILKADREKKVEELKEKAEIIASLEQSDGSMFKQGKAGRDLRLQSLRKRVNKLQILADINDPVVRRRSEDGVGDMNKPIYRYLAHRKWRSYEYLITMQRIKQFNIVPDMLPKLDPTASVRLYFHRKKIQPGAIVDSAVSEHPVRLNMQLFNPGPRLLSVAVVDLDVPDVENDSYRKRCHFLAVNIPFDPTVSSLPLWHIRDPSQLVQPWMAPYAHEGAPYHRLAVVVLEQPGLEPLDTAKLKEQHSERLGFSVKSFNYKTGCTPIGFNLFRTVWDENMEAVMERNKYDGLGEVFRRVRVHSLKPRRKARGWEAKRQGPKYRHLWKYTKRIRGLSNGRGWTKR
ncbi:mitochondrial 54S ribosomal protein YmL35 [Ceratocystis pirilliformis]|uniref:Mitochondrial 54S ribosomal protein YmL35 n=1 Tax=Ceratocystis pirilliformis TaxID=259994 RepID=A0ABR3YXU6_9PEZI